MGYHALDNETLVESHEIGVISEYVTNTPEEPSITQAMRHVVLFIVNALINIIDNTLIY